MKKTLFLLLLAPFLLNAQNTIGGTKVSVPEAEVDRQSEFLMAERERLLNHNDKALDRYKRFTYDNPTIDAGWYGLARTYAALNDLPNAMQAIGKATTLSPDNQWYSVFQADLYEKAGRMPDAVAVYEALVKRFPKTPEFYEQLAYLSLQVEDPKRALKALDKWEELAGVNEEITYKKHVIYIGLGDMKKAAAELRKLADEYPNETKYRRDLGDFYDKMGDKANARAAYEAVLKKNPDDTVARMALAGAQQNSDEGKLDALKPLFNDPSVAIDEKIKAIMPYFQKIDGGNTALMPKLLDLAGLLEKNHADDAKAWSLSGDLYYHADKLPEALDRYRRCLSLNPSVFAVWDNTLTILALQKNFDELLSTSERAIDAFPNQPKAYFYYGVAANLKGKPGNALDMLEQGLLMTAGNPELRLDMIDQVGLSLMAKKNYAEAAKRLEQGLAKGGDRHPGLLEHMGDALSLQGKGAEAVDYWKKANAIRHSPVLDQKIAAGKL